ncbi:MAG: DNA translocase FtsK 4TM domain-containing protein [Phycisphaeraceae bacterium]|nr:DNA translocase FtsK 4TM domain-containing protein [Phycisphaeraceae bacterium]
MASRTSSKSRASSPTASGINVGLAGRRLALVLLLFVWVFVLMSLIGFDPGDPPSHVISPPNATIHNWCGAFGAAVSYWTIYYMGAGAWVLFVLGGIVLASGVVGTSLSHLAVRLIGIVMFAASVSGFQALIFKTTAALPDLPGGVMGTVGVEQLLYRFGPMGSAIWLGAMGIIGLVVAADEWLNLGVGWSWNWMRTTGAPAAAVAGGAAAKFTADVVAPAAAKATVATAKGSAGFFSRFIGNLSGKTEASETDLESIAEAKPARRFRRSNDPNSAPEAMFPGESGMDSPRSRLAEFGFVSEEPAPSPVVEDPDFANSEAGIDAAGETDDADDDSEAVPAAIAPTPATKDVAEDELPGAPQVFDRDSLRDKINRLPIAFGQKDKQVATQADLEGMQNASEMEGYRFPQLEMLEEPEENFNEKLEELVRQQGMALESAMKEYGIDGEVVGIESGPVITLYDVRLAPGTKVAVVQAVSSDIARSLKAVNIRIVANQVGRDTVGIEVPNPTKEKVRLKELMGKTELFGKMKLPMFLGKDATGQPLIADLTRMPHMLIAGTTGSGKSVCMNTIIMSFLFTKKPNELKLVLVDPKMVEMSQFKDIPHLMCPVVTEMNKAAAILEWATVKMDERYELLMDAGCRDIASYNELPWEELKERMNLKSDEEAARIPRKLPYMVFIIDELADLMMTAKEVEGHIIRIAQKARAVGIHLILATQRPQANVVTGLIKSNMPCRISFKVASGMDSRIVLDSKGGELLLGHGDMLFLNPGSNDLSRAQGTLVTDSEIRKVVKFMKEVATPTFERQLMVMRKPSEEGSGLGNLSDEERFLQSKNNSSASLKAAQEDPLFERAVEIVLESRRGSVSLLQRRLAIGYTRSSRLIDLMGIAGIISDHKGSVARDVLITLEEWEMMKEMAKEEAAAKGIAWPAKESEQAQLFNGEAPAADPADGPESETVAETAEEAGGEVEHDEDDEGETPAAPAAAPRPESKPIA